MILIIAARTAGPYLGDMASALFRLLALFAILLMPVGVSAAPALAQPGVASTADCTDHHEPVDLPSEQQAHCAACAALPAIEVPGRVAAWLPRAPRTLVQAQPIPGIEPEIATPPPRLS